MASSSPSAIRITRSSSAVVCVAADLVTILPPFVAAGGEEVQIISKKI
jgi:hypothetical protein